MTGDSPVVFGPALSRARIRFTAALLGLISSLPR
jgi:hypothetical protein